MTISIGFDIGATFTDLMLFDSASDRWHVAKVRTTPRDLATGCMDGIRSVLPPTISGLKIVEGHSKIST